MGDSWFDYDKRLRPEMLKGKPVTVEIRSFAEVRRDDYGKEKIVPVLYFKGTDKYLELNDTNRMTLVRMFGDKKSAAIGKKIMLITETVRNGKTGIVIHPTSQTAETKTEAAEATSTPLATLFEYAGNFNLSMDQVNAILERAHGDASKAHDLINKEYELKQV